MSRKPVFTVCFVASVMLLGGFQLWADGPNGAGEAPIQIQPVVSGFNAALVVEKAHRQHDLGDGLRAKLKQSSPNNLATFELTVVNTGSERVKCAVDIELAVSEQSFMSRVPRPPTVKKHTDKMVVWLDAGETKTKTIKTTLPAGDPSGLNVGMGTGVSVTIKRAGTVIPGALTMGVVAPAHPLVRPNPIRIEPIEVPRELPRELPRKAVLVPEVFSGSAALGR